MKVTLILEQPTYALLYNLMYVFVTYSSRLSLREKHSKHLADLRSYYEEELRELRRALTESLDTTGTSVDHGSHATIENQLLEAENRHLLDKCRTMEDELEDLYQ